MSLFNFVCVCLCVTMIVSHDSPLRVVCFSQWPYM